MMANHVHAARPLDHGIIDYGAKNLGCETYNSLNNNNLASVAVYVE